MKRLRSGLRELNPVLFILLPILLFQAGCPQEKGEDRESPAPVQAEKAYDPGTANPDRDRLLPEEEPARKPEMGGIVNSRYPLDPHTLNNLTRTGRYAKDICWFLYPGLLWMDRDTFESVPFTAASLPEVSQDQRVHTWKLRPGLKWHDFDRSGAYVTTRDVLFSFRIMNDPAVGARRTAADFVNLKEIRKVDDLTFQAVYDPPSPNDAFKMGREFRIMPAHLLEDVPPGEIPKHSIGRAPVGYGPFRFIHWRNNQEILLARDDLNREVFPEAFRPHIAGLRFRTIPDSDLVYPLFLRGEIDICALGFDDWQFRTDDPEFRKRGTRHVYYLPTYYYIAWNNDSPLFDDARVRKAMTHMVRREEVLQTHLHGMGKLLSGPFFYFSRAYDRSIEPLPFDPKAAAALLEEAGFKDSDGDGMLDKEVDGKTVKFEFEILKSTMTSGFQEALFSAMKEDLRMIGVKMTVRELEWSALLEQYGDHHFDAVTMAYGTKPVFEDPYAGWHSSQTRPGGSNRAGYRNPEADILIEQARIEFDDARRYAILKKFHRIIHEDQPFTFLYSWASPVIINRRWRNVKIHKLGVNFYEWWLPSENRTSFDRIPE